MVTEYLFQHPCKIQTHGIECVSLGTLSDLINSPLNSSESGNDILPWTQLTKNKKVLLFSRANERQVMTINKDLRMSGLTMIDT